MMYFYIYLYIITYQVRILKKFQYINKKFDMSYYNIYITDIINTYTTFKNTIIKISY